MDVKNILIVILHKKFIWKFLDAIHKFANFVLPYKGSDKHLMHGLWNPILLLESLVLTIVPLILAWLSIWKINYGITFLLLYMDNMAITGSDVSGISNLKQSLHQHFEMKDLEHPYYILVLRFSLILLTTISLKLNMFKTF